MNISQALENVDKLRFIDYEKKFSSDNGILQETLFRNFANSLEKVKTEMKGHFQSKFAKIDSQLGDMVEDQETLMANYRRLEKRMNLTSNDTLSTVPCDLAIIHHDFDEKLTNFQREMIRRHDRGMAEIRQELRETLKNFTHNIQLVEEKQHDLQKIYEKKFLNRKRKLVRILNC